MKYHYFHRFFTNSVERSLVVFGGFNSGLNAGPCDRQIRSDDSVRRGV